MSSDDKTETNKENIATEIRDTFSSGEGWGLTRTLLAYVFDRQIIVDAILTQEWQGLMKPIKYFLATFGILAASVAIFGPSEPNADRTVGNVLQELLPFILFLAGTLPFAALMHFFMGSHGRNLSDTIRVFCYSAGTSFICSAAVMPFGAPLNEGSPDWLLFVFLLIFIFIIYLTFIRPYQIPEVSYFLYPITDTLVYKRCRIDGAY